MTRARVKALHDKVNSLLSTFDLGSTLDGVLLHSDTLCILRYEPPKPRMHGTSSMSKPGEEGEEGEENLPGGSEFTPQPRPDFSEILPRAANSTDGGPEF